MSCKPNIVSTFVYEFITIVEDAAVDHKVAGTVELVEDVISSVRIVFLFIYVLYEIVYELGMDAIKQSDKNR